MEGGEGVVDLPICRRIGVSLSLGRTADDPGFGPLGSQLAYRSDVLRRLSLRVISSIKAQAKKKMGAPFN